MNRHRPSIFSIKSTDSCRGSDDESVTSYRFPKITSQSNTSPLSSLTSLETTTSSRRGLLRGNADSRKTIIRFDDDIHQHGPRIAHTIRRRLKDGEFPMSDVNMDKSTASQAVAFVIRASRRGVVPLCAEVADLLKEKTSLEALIEEQREEILKLQENQALPLVPPVETKDFSLQTVQEMCSQTTSFTDQQTQTQPLVLPCNRKKNLTEGINDESKEISLPGLKFSCGSNYSVTCLCPSSTTSSTQNPQKSSRGCDTTSEERWYSDLGYFDHKNLEHCHKALKHDHIQLKTKTEESIKRNENLSYDLDAAKREIVSLQKSIQEIQSKEYERIQEEERLKNEDRFSVEVQTDDDVYDDVREKPQTADVIIVGEKSSYALPMETKDERIFRSSIFPGPILGCKCQMCKAFFKSSGILGFASSPYVTDSSGRNPVLRDLRKLVSLQNSKLQLQPQDQVLVRNNKVGVVKYVGHLDSVGTPSVVYVGVELELPDGRHDGYLYGKRYFFCSQKHGLFLPLQDVLCVINRKIAMPTVQRRHLAISSSSNPIRKVSVDGRRTKRENKAGSCSISSTNTTSSSEENRLPELATR